MAPQEREGSGRLWKVLARHGRPPSTGRAARRRVHKGSSAEPSHRLACRAGRPRRPLRAPLLRARAPSRRPSVTLPLVRAGARAEAAPAGPWTRVGDAAPARWQDGRGRDPRPECDPRPRTAPLPRSRPLGAEEGSPGRGRPQCPPQTEVSRRRGPGRRIWAGECRPGPFLAKFQPVPGATGTWQGEPPPQHHAVPRATHSAADRGWFLFAHGQTG